MSTSTCTTTHSIDRAAERAALKTFGNEVLMAPNGYFVRWARNRCIADLKSAGHEPASAKSLAASMSRFAVGFANHARAKHAEFNLGAIA